MTTTPKHQTADITQGVLDRLGECHDPRFKELISAVIRHVHALAREVDLKPDEWMRAIQFLTAAGQKCDDKRQEVILLSDTLGLSMLVVQLDQARRSKAALADQSAVKVKPTEATVQGPFYWQGSPVLPLGSDIGKDVPGEPAHYSGRVTDTQGRPLAGVCLDVWSGDGDGFYDMQLADVGMRLRGRFHTDADGRYHFWSIKPYYYPVPVDGPVGDMLRAMGRHPNRPGHIHMMVGRDGYVPLTTHIFAADSPYLDSDAVFGVRDSLIVNYEKHAPGKGPDGRALDRTWHSTGYDFVLAAAA